LKINFEKMFILLWKRIFWVIYKVEVEIVKNFILRFNLRKKRMKKKWI